MNLTLIPHSKHIGDYDQSCRYKIVGVVRDDSGRYWVIGQGARRGDVGAFDRNIMFRYTDAPSSNRSIAGAFLRQRKMKNR